MFEIPRRRPSFSQAEARQITAAEYGIGEAKMVELPGERDQNFHLTCPDGREFVLKISHAEERKENLEFQLQALSHLQRNCPDLNWPEVQPAQSGGCLAQARNAEGETHHIRLVTYLPGVPLARVRPHSPELLRNLGRALGKIDRALEDFHHEGAHRHLQWDLFHGPEVLENYAESIEDPELHALVDHYYNRFTTHLRPRLSKLRRSVIHNDANDYNVLVGPPRAAGREVTGIIDLGDMVHTATVFEVAVACTYVMMEKEDPLAVAGWLVSGYHEVNPFRDEELEALYLLICMRLSVSVTLAAFQRRREPNNDYLSISEQPARELLSRLMDINPNYAHYRFREACGLPPCPRGERTVAWLKENAGRIGKIIEHDLRREPVHRFDLSVGSTELGLCADMTDPAKASEIMFRRIREAGARVGIGLYNEARRFYTSPLFQTGEAGEWRTIHIGTDIFIKPYSPVFAPLDGEVHSLQVNTSPLDYGPTIILEHRVPDENLKFYTLYGHLTADSLDGLYAGMAIRQGDQIARVGDRPENGNWPPHLHFQIIADMMDYIGDFPGVALPSQRRLWLSLAPDPNLILRLPGGCSAVPRYAREELLAERRRHLGPNLSLAYREPLAIVRGAGAYLYDENGQGYLDLVNNVCHVGHCHPRVVAAGQQQMAVLNTNTRYLHENIVSLARELCATLPEPLRVCYFVCSGSEANELALRLAQTHTGQRDIMVLAGGYHGNSGLLVDVSAYKFDGPGGRGAPSHVHVLPLPDGYRGPYKYGDPECSRNYARAAADVLKELAARQKGLSAFLAESIPGCAGQVMLPPDYLKEVYGQVRQAGGVCIADEVQTGFGRVGSHYWAFQTQGVVPDIVTMGKPMGNGHPVAAVVTTPEIAASFDTGMEYFNTFGGNPVSCAIAREVMAVIEAEDLQAHARRQGDRLGQALRELQARHPIMGDVRGVGLFQGVELVVDRKSLSPAREQAQYIVERLKEKGILLSIDGPLHNVLKIKPPLVISGADIDFFLAALEDVLAEDFIGSSVQG